MRPIAFYQPSRVVGGVEMLFIRLMRALAELGREVYVVDYPDGVQARAIAGSSVRLIPVADGVALRLPPGTIAVTPLHYLYVFHREVQLPSDGRLVLWTLHPLHAGGLFPPTPSFGRRRDRIVRRLSAFDRALARRAVRKLNEHGALFFMDDDCWLGTESILGPLRGPRFLPVMLPTAGVKRPALRQQRLERLAWLGRLSASKVSVLLRLLEDLDERTLATGRVFDFTVIGDGEERARLESHVARLRGVRVTFAGTLVGTALDDELASHHTLFAVGMSALEGARVGLPTVLLDECSHPIAPEGYGYRWLFEAKGYSVGSVIDRELPKGRRPLSALVDELDDPQRALEIAAACAAYVEAQHSLERWAPRAAAMFDASTADARVLANLAVSGPMRRLGRLSRSLFRSAR